MKIPLNNFEQYIEDDILKRGLSYFMNNHVNEPEEISPGKYEAIVEGTQNYTVCLTIEKGIIIDSTCNCPYDSGSVCKHIVALIFYLQQDETGIKQKKTSQVRPKTNGKKKINTVSEKVNHLLEQISHEELKKFIREKAEFDSEFRNTLFSSFAYLNINESKDLYKKQLRSILKTAAGKERFIWGFRARQVGKVISDFLTTAQKHSDNGNYTSAIYICQAVMEEITDALQYADDSYEDFGSGILTAFDILFDITISDLQEELRKMLFDYCTSSFGKHRFAGWDWHLGMMELAVNLMINDEESKKIIMLLDLIPESKYDKERAQRLKFNIIKQTKTEEQENEFIRLNLSDDYFRHEAISKAIGSKNYEEAMQLALDGVKLDSKDRPGLVHYWNDRMVDIALIKGDKDKIIEYSRKIFFGNFINNKDYYQLMKDNVEPEKWNDFVEQMLSELLTSENWLRFDLIAKIYIREKWWHRLLGLISEKLSIHYLEAYEKYLSSEYPKEVAELYSKCVVKYLGENAGRSHYKKACRYLRRMLKLGAKEEVEKLIKLFREKYKLRKALMEELEKL